jgi:phosphonate transport system substrate-binding protein
VPVSTTAAHPVGPAAGGAGRRTRTLFIAVAAGVAAVAVGGGLLLGNLLSDEPTEATADPASQAAPALWPGSLTVAIAAEDAGGNGQATLATILEGELGIEVDVVQRNDKVSVAEALADQEAALGILDPYVYVGATGSGAAIRPAGVEASTSADDGIARTYGLTRAGSSTIGSLADVGDQVVCFPDRTSLEGYQFPMAGLLAAGIDPGSLRSEVAGSYEAAIEFAIDGTCPVAFASEAAVADLIASGALSGVVDGTGEGDDVNPQVAEVTIIWKSDPITSDPIVVGTWLPPDLQDQIVEIVTQKANRDWADANGYCTAASPCVVNGSDGWGYAAATDADFNGYRQLCQLPDIDRCDQ